MMYPMCNLGIMGKGHVFNFEHLFKKLTQMRAVIKNFHIIHITLPSRSQRGMFFFKSIVFQVSVIFKLYYKLYLKMKLLKNHCRSIEKRLAIKHDIYLCPNCCYPSLQIIGLVLISVKIIKFKCWVFFRNQNQRNKDC